MIKGRILVTGGCGYIGSHTIVELIESGFEVICVDSLINSNEESLNGVHSITGVQVVNLKIDLTLDSSVELMLNQISNVDGIIHFAALKAVGESVDYALSYYDNNLKSLLNILKFKELLNIKAFVFSSSCTVYGETKVLPVKEELDFKPTSSPYGRSKQMCEQIIMDHFASKNCSGKAISLRYFNPAGAHPSLHLGESPINPALNLVPIITETAIGLRKGFSVFGNDYDTRDGTCIRDYIHVVDLAKAHTLALESILTNEQELNLEYYNLGIGEGVSVLEAINSFEQITNIQLNYNIIGRRPGDLAATFADNSKIRKNLRWEPRYNIDDIMRDAWAWEQKRRA
ncbi:MAG: UDP-glucose 4-epimerase GalE [Saprospiraceae bacterium]